MKNNTMLRISTILAGSLLCATMAWAATDYSAMTNEELAAKRGSLQQATMEERNAFQNEWQNRVQKMSPEEKQKFMSKGENAQGQGMRSEKQERNQDRMQQRQEQGSGMGSGNMGSGGSGMGGGSMGSGMGGGMGRGGMGGGGRR